MNDSLIFILGTWGVIVVLGVVLGIRGSVTVFRNYSDLALVALLAFTVFITFFVIGEGKAQGDSATGFLLIVILFLFLWVFFRTLRDNPSLFQFPLALVTKLTLCLLVVPALFQLLVRPGSTARERRENTQNALLWVLLFVPLIYALTRDKSFASPKQSSPVSQDLAEQEAISESLDVDQSRKQLVKHRTSEEIHREIEAMRTLESASHNWSTMVRFHPWVGRRYADRVFGGRMMILGESQYAEVPQGLVSTQRLIQEHIDLPEPYIKVYKAIEHTVKGR